MAQAPSESDVDIHLNLDRLGWEMLLRAWTREDLAEAADISPKTVHRIWTAQGRSTTRTRLKILRALRDNPRLPAELLDVAGVKQS